MTSAGAGGISGRELALAVLSDFARDGDHWGVGMNEMEVRKCNGYGRLTGNGGGLYRA